MTARDELKQAVTAQLKAGQTPAQIAEAVAALFNRVEIDEQTVDATTLGDHERHILHQRMLTATTAIGATWRTTEPFCAHVPPCPGGSP